MNSRGSTRVNPAYISAISALCGSAIGALASLASTWLHQRHQDETRQKAQEIARRERIFVEFIDLASKAFADSLLQTSIEDPTKIVLLYATMGKLRLFASEGTVEAAEKAMGKMLDTYYGPKFDLQTRPAIDQSFDILRDFAERCRAELH
jgi:hypothetical protein